MVWQTFKIKQLFKCIECKNIEIKEVYAPTRYSYCSKCGYLCKKYDERTINEEIKTSTLGGL